MDFLQRNPRYSAALRSRTTQGFVRGLQEAGYATDPRYAAKILGIRDQLRRMSVESVTQTEPPTQVSAARADKAAKG